jgi:hypothetical protein
MTLFQPQNRHNISAVPKLGLTHFLPKLGQPLRWLFFVAEFFYENRQSRKAGEVVEYSCRWMQEASCVQSCPPGYWPLPALC